jgi:hypothetical protein
MRPLHLHNQVGWMKPRNRKMNRLEKLARTYQNLKELVWGEEMMRFLWSGLDFYAV